MKRLQFLCLAFLFLPACKKSEPPFKGYFRLSIDGAPADYSQKISANSASGSGNELICSGETTFGSLLIEMGNATLGETRVTGNFYSLRFTFSDFANQQQYYAGDAGISGDALGSGKINITELSNEYVKGTFDFITAPGLFSNTKKTITNGEFYIRRAN